MIEAELVRYGYAVLFFGVALEGDLFLLAAAFLAHRGYLHLGWVIAVATLGTLAADQVYYQLARWRGRDAFARRAASDPRFERVRRWIETRGTLLLFLSRFMYGFRIAIPASCGAIGMPAVRFTVVNFIGSVVWAVCFGLAGYAFGNALEVLLADVARYERAIAVVLLLTGAVVLVLRGRGLRGSLAAAREPSQAIVQGASRLFATAHQAGRLVLTRPHVRLAAFVVAVGALNAATAIFHWHFLATDLVDVWLPIEVHHVGRAAMLLTGIGLMALGRGLSRRKRTAWFIALLLAAASVALHMSHHASIVRAILSMALIVELAVQAHRFTARTDPIRLRNGLVALPVLALALSLYGMAGYERLHRAHDPRAALAMTWQAAALQPPGEPGDRPARAFGWSVGFFSLVAAAYVFGALLAPVAWRPETPASLEEIARIAALHGHDSMSYFAKQPDKLHARVGRASFVACRVVRRVAVVAGDPVGPEEDVPAAIGEFVDRCGKNDWVPVFYETSDRWLAVYAARGLRFFKVAEEAVIPLATFSLAGGKVAKVRQSIAKVERAAPGLEVWEYKPDARDPDVDEQLEDVSAEWLRAKGSAELGFNLGVFSVDDLADKRTIVAASSEGYVWAFLTWLPYRGGRALVLDAMRRRDDAPPSVMDLLIARSAMQFKAEGLEAISLAAAPLASAGEPADPSVYDRGVKLIFDHFSSVYGYRTLFQFKKKFNPAWEARYLVFPRPDLLPRIAYALAAVHVEGGLVAAAWHFVSSRVATRRRDSRPAEGSQE